MRRPLSILPALIAGALGLALASNAAAWQTKSSTTKSNTKQPHCYDVEVQKPKEVKDQHKITGSVVGGLAGGLLGNQIGGGSGKQIATVAGAVGGAVVGNQVEGNMKATKSYEIRVRLDNGSTRTFHQNSAPRWAAGDRVRVVKGALRSAA